MFTEWLNVYNTIDFRIRELAAADPFSDLSSHHRLFHAFASENVEEVRKDISDYAATNSFETFAETFIAQRNGSFNLSSRVADRLQDMLDEYKKNYS